MKRVISAVCVLFALALLCEPPVWAQAGSAAEDLKSPDEKVRIKAARELGKSGNPSSVPALAAAVTDSSVKVRQEVVIALTAIRAAESLDPLIAATRDEDPKIRELALDGLVGYYTGETRPTGFTGFFKRTWQQAKGRFVEEDVRIDPGIHVEPKVIAALVTTMNDPLSIEPARQAAAGLGVLLAASALPDLVKAAYSPDEELAIQALHALAKIRDRSAGPQLLNLLDTTNKEVKGEVAVTVGVLGTTDALPKLRAIYTNHPDKQVRKKALEGLAYLGNPLTADLFVQALWSSDKDLRTFGAEGMARVRDAKALTDLENAVATEKDGGVRLAMQFALASLGKSERLGAVVEELGSTIRGDVARVYLTELSHDAKILPQLYPFLSNPDPTVRLRLCTVLMYTGDNSSVEHLERLSHDKNSDVATEALRALRAVRLRAAS